jgi:hypothetical protein
MIVKEDDPGSIGRSYLKPPMCGCRSMYIYARRGMQCGRRRRISELIARVGS